MEDLSMEGIDFTWQWVHALCISFGLVNIGAAFGSSAVLIPALQNETDANLRISMEEGTNMVFYLLLFCLIGNSLSGFPADILGRKPVMVVSQMIFPLSWIVIANSSSLLHVWISRIMMGTADGVYFAVAIVYVSEISSATIRGSVMGAIIIGQNIGTLLIYILGKMFVWRTFCWIMVAISSICFISLFCVLDETPYHLLLMNKEKKARTVMQKLRGKNFDITEELKEMLEQKKKHQQDDVENGFKENFGQFMSTLLSRRFLKPCSINFPLSFCVGLSGVFNLVFLIITIFQESDTTVDPFLASIAIALIKTAVSCLAPVALKMFPQRKLFSASYIIVSICYGLVAANSYVKDCTINGECNDFLSFIPEGLQNVIFNWTPIVCLSMTSFVFTVGAEAVLKVLAGELFPTQVRSLGSSVSSVSLLTSMIIASSSLPYLMKYFFFHGTFAIFSAVSLFTAVLSHFIIPETKGKTLARLENDFAQ